MTALFTNYTDFRNAVQQTARKSDVFFSPPVEGVGGFSAAVAVPSTAVVLRFDADNAPESFGTDFPEAVVTQGLS